MIFGKICYVVCTINHAGKFICLRAWLHKHDRTGLIDKPDYPHFLGTKRFGKDIPFKHL